MFVVQVLISGVICLLSFHYFKVFSVRRKLHWIKSIPGWPFFGNVLDFRKSTEFLNVLEDYCNRTEGLCRMELVTSPFIVASEPKFLEFLLSSTEILDKTQEYRYLHKWLGRGLLTSTGGKWKKQRKLLTPAFHFGILDQFIMTIETNAGKMIECMEKELRKPVFDVYPYATACALDIICEAAMGVSLNSQDNAHSEYVTAVKEMCRIVVDRTFHPIKRFDLTYPLSRDYYKEKQYIKTLHDFTNAVIDSKKADRLKAATLEEELAEEILGERKKRPFLDLLLDADIDGVGLTHEEIREEVDTFMFEGHDTTSSAISFILYCLANYPEYQTQCMTEQKIIFGPHRHREVTSRDLNDMKFLEAVIKESLRLYPSVPFYGRLTSKEMEYKDGNITNIIPKDVNILVFAFGANRNPVYFEKPEVFNPYRFSDSTHRSPYTYVPFSAGPRNCIGQKFAMLVMKCVVSKILRNYVILSAGSQYQPILAAETVLKSLNGVNIKIVRRDWR